MSDNDKSMVQYEERDEGRIAVITLDRPEARNAQNKQMTYEFGIRKALERAARANLSPSQTVVR